MFMNLIPTTGLGRSFACGLARGQIEARLVESLEGLLDVSESDPYIIEHQKSILCKDKLLDNPSSGPI
jgi:hypothetical protein